MFLSIKEEYDSLLYYNGEPVFSYLRGSGFDVKPVRADFVHLELVSCDEVFNFSLQDSVSYEGFINGELLDEFVIDWAISRGFIDSYKWTSVGGLHPLFFKRDGETAVIEPYISGSDLIWFVVVKLFPAWITECGVRYSSGSFGNPVMIDNSYLKRASFEGEFSGVRVTGSELAELADEFFKGHSELWFKFFGMFSRSGRSGVDLGVVRRRSEEIASLLEACALEFGEVFSEVFFKIFRVKFDVLTAFEESFWAVVGMGEG